MKYIRTKDGRIIPFLDEDRETKLPTRDLRFYYIRPDNAIAFIGKDEIIKQADAIEELCDEFVIIYENESKLVNPLCNSTKYEIAKNYCKKHIVYGAIWTDKGLIYVANMNDKGELELL